MPPKKTTTLPKKASSPKKTSSPSRAPAASCQNGRSISMLVLCAVAVLVVLLVVVRCLRKRNKSSRSSRSSRSPAREYNCGMKGESMYFFHANWCPHCKKAMPEVQEFEAYAKKTFPGKKVRHVSIVDPVEPDASIISCLNVQSVPTVFFVGKTGRFQKLNAACTFQNLKDMAHQVWA